MVTCLFSKGSAGASLYYAEDAWYNFLPPAVPFPPMEPVAPIVVDLADSLSRVVRGATLPRFTERVADHAGVHLDRSAYVLLVRLSERPWRVGELAEHLCLDVSTVSRQVQALEEARLARRERHPTDRRGWVVVIDEGGIVAVEAHRRARREIFAELLGDASTDELETVTSVLHRLAERIDTFNLGEP
jgi:DNA-binding MarR family transcriptional regulator